MRLPRKIKQHVKRERKRESHARNGSDGRTEQKKEVLCMLLRSAASCLTQTPSLEKHNTDVEKEMGHVKNRLECPSELTRLIKPVVLKVGSQGPKGPEGPHFFC